MKIEPLIKFNIMSWMKENEKDCTGIGQGTLNLRVQDKFKIDINPGLLAGWARSIEIKVARPKFIPTKNNKTDNDFERYQETTNATLASLRKQTQCLFAQSKNNTDLINLSTNEMAQKITKLSSTFSNETNKLSRKIRDLENQMDDAVAVDIPLIKKKIKKLRKGKKRHQQFLFILFNAVEYLFFILGITRPVSFHKKIEKFDLDKY